MLGQTGLSQGGRTLQKVRHMTIGRARCGLAVALAVVFASLITSGQAVGASCPGSITPKCPYDSVISVGSGSTVQLRSPDGVAVGPDGRVYVTDESAGQGALAQLDVFDKNGTFLRQLVPDSQDLHVFQPSRVAVSPTGDVYALDRVDPKVWHFNAAGDYLGSFQAGPSGIGCCIAAASDGTLWVVDSTDSLVEHYGPTGVLLSRFATTPNTYYDAIAVSPDDHIFLSRGSVDEYDDSGKLLGQHGIDVYRGMALDGAGKTIYTTWDGTVNSVGRDGSNPSSFTVSGASALGGIGVEQSGSLVVADPDHHQLDFFTPDGTLVKAVGQPDPASLFAPSDAWTTTGGQFVVSDTENHRLARFDADGRYLGRADDGSLGSAFWPGSGAFDPVTGGNVTSDAFNIYDFGSDGSLFAKWAVSQSSYSGLGEDVAVDSKGVIYGVLSAQPSERGSIAKYASDGQELGRISGDHIANPLALAIGPNDTLYVLQGWYSDQATGETVPPSIDVFSSGGDYLRSYPQLACQPIIDSIAVDAQGRIFLGETYFISIYDRDGNLLASFGRAANEFSATRLTVDGNDVLSVTDSWNNRVSRFHIDSTALQPIPPSSECEFPQPTVAPASTSLHVSNGRTTVSLHCDGHEGTQCSGNATLMLAARRKRLRGTPPGIVAATSFRIPAGKTELVPLNLNHNARRRLHRTSRLRASLVLTLAGRPPVAHKVVLHRRRHR